MSIDNLSISFASSMGIENIKDEFLKDDINLYNDLDDLEKSVEAEFEQYMNQARSFPFHNQTTEQSDLKDASVHSDYDISGEDVIEQVNNKSMNSGSYHPHLNSVEANEDYNEQPLLDNNSLENEGAESLGAYFGARSLPLNSVDDVWRQTPSFELSEDDAENPSSLKQSLSIEKKSKYKAPLEARFKSLPDNIRLFPKYELPEIKIHHPYTQRNFTSPSSISSTRQQYSSRNKQAMSSSQVSSRNIRALDSFHGSFDGEAEEPSCIIEPASPLSFLCEISEKTIYAKVVHLKINNTSPNVVRSFSLFSQNNLLEFELSEGMILEHEVMDIKIKIRSSALTSYRRRLQEELQPLQEKLLVLIDRKHVNELEVRIDFISLIDDDSDEVVEKVPNRPKCKYCALEKGFSVHCL